MKTEIYVWISVNTAGRGVALLLALRVLQGHGGSQDSHFGGDDG